MTPYESIRLIWKVWLLEIPSRVKWSYFMCSGDRSQTKYWYNLYIDQIGFWIFKSNITPSIQTDAMGCFCRYKQNVINNKSKQILPIPTFIIIITILIILLHLHYCGHLCVLVDSPLFVQYQHQTNRAIKHSELTINITQQTHLLMLNTN